MTWQSELVMLTAQDIMTRNPVSARSGMMVQEAAAFLLDKGFSAAPVVNDAGRALGVVSLTDIARCTREHVAYAKREVYQSASRKLASGERVGEGFQVENVPCVTVDEVMTPLLFTIKSSTPACTVMDEMVKRDVHRLYVTDDSGNVIGVITSLDVLRRLK